MVVFIQLDEPDYAKWRESSTREYAADKVKAGNSEEEHSIEDSEKEFSSLLSDGPKTQGQYLYSVIDERDGQRVGVIWYGELPRGRKDAMRASCARAARLALKVPVMTDSPG